MHRDACTTTKAMVVSVYGVSRVCLELLKYNGLDVSCCQRRRRTFLFIRFHRMCRMNKIDYLSWYFLLWSNVRAILAVLHDHDWHAHAHTHVTEACMPMRNSSVDVVRSDTKMEKRAFHEGAQCGMSNTGTRYIYIDIRGCLKRRMSSCFVRSSDRNVVDVVSSGPFWALLAQSPNTSVDACIEKALTVLDVISVASFIPRQVLHHVLRRDRYMYIYYIYHTVVCFMIERIIVFTFVTSL